MVVSSYKAISGDKIHEIWTYNLWTERWRENIIPEDLPSTAGCCGVAIKSDIYMFGGHGLSCMFWKLISVEGVFQWNNISMKSAKIPSPRSNPCGWEYGEKVWIFGGFGELPSGYLNDHGCFAGGMWPKQNNQLFYYDPSISVWNNVQNTGEVPSPRSSASTAIVGHKVWLYGGVTGDDFDQLDDLYELNMVPLSWTRIKANVPRPGAGCASSLTSLTATQLLYGGSPEYKSLWILDVESYTWSQYPGSFGQGGHSGTTGLHNEVIILGGFSLHGHTFQPSLFVRLGPKLLQQLAVGVIYENREALPWKSLPPKLTHKMMAFENE